MIYNYSDFTTQLLAAGFSMGSGGNDGIYAAVPWNWNEEPPYDTPVRWHTGDPETDPWEWRMRVLEERDDIAYAKVFFQKSGFITLEWAPCFLAARRPGDLSFTQAYADGTVSHAAKRIYEVVRQQHVLPMPAIKAMAGFGREDKAQFDRALTELQMRMFITMCGQQQQHAWPSTVFCTTEQFWGDEVLAQAAAMDPDDAVQAIAAQVRKLNPNAQEKKITKFIMG